MVKTVEAPPFGIDVAAFLAVDQLSRDSEEVKPLLEAADTIASTEASLDGLDYEFFSSLGQRVRILMRDAESTLARKEPGLYQQLLAYYSQHAYTHHGFDALSEELGLKAEHALGQYVAAFLHDAEVDPVSDFDEKEVE